MKRNLIDFCKSRINNLSIVGNTIQRYRMLHYVILFLVTVLEIFFIIYWGINTKNYTSAKSLTYLFSYIILLVASIASLIVLVINEKKKIPFKYLGLFIHTYGFILMAWATVIAIMDLRAGNGPIVLFTISLVMCAFLLLDSIFYIFLTFIAYAIIFVFSIVDGYPFFSNAAVYINVSIFVLSAILSSIRNYNISINEARQREYLKRISYTDQLTGLGNETAYYKMIEELTTEINKNTANFGIVVLDLNNLKHTNDQYGHRFGCHLVVTCGHILPSIFPSSKHYHIGGDEFVVIVTGDDLLHIEDRLLDFEKKLDYTKVEFEDHELLLSVAKGYAFHKGSDTYNETFQIADMDMYKNKELMKEKYNIAIRQKDRDYSQL